MNEKFLRTYIKDNGLLSVYKRIKTRTDRRDWMLLILTSLTYKIYMKQKNQNSFYKEVFNLAKKYWGMVK